MNKSDWLTLCIDTLRTEYGISPERLPALRDSIGGFVDYFYMPESFRQLHKNELCTCKDDCLHIHPHDDDRVQYVFVSQYNERWDGFKGNLTLCCDNYNTGELRWYVGDVDISKSMYQKMPK